MEINSTPDAGDLDLEQLNLNPTPTDESTISEPGIESLFTEDAFRKQWKYRVQRIVRERRNRCPSSILHLSFSYRRLCHASGYAKGMFEEEKEEDPLSIPNDEEKAKEEYLESDDEVFGPKASEGPIPYPERVCSYTLQDPRFPFLSLMTLYGMVGLHHYNMLNGTEYDIYDIKKITRQKPHFSTYFITLVAYKPTIDGYENIRDSQKTTFQVRVDEHLLNGLSLTCPIARPLGQGCDEESLITCDDFHEESLPKWPSKRDVDDPKRFYVVEKADLLYTNDWIYFYLHLVLAASNRWIRDSDLFKVEIVQVAIETDEEEVEPLKAKSANVFIKYKDWDKADCKAIVRRVVDKRGWLSLVGDVSGGRALTSEEQAFVDEMNERFGCKVVEQPSMAPEW